jgi:hypothetical protein
MSGYRKLGASIEAATAALTVLRRALAKLPEDDRKGFDGLALQAEHAVDEIRNSVDDLRCAAYALGDRI